MPSTSFNDGGITKFVFDGITGTYGINTSLNISHTPRETTNKDTSGGKKSYKPGLLDVTGSAEFLFTEDGTWNYEDAFDAINTRATVEMDYTSLVASDINYTGTCYFTGITKTSPNTGENETYTIDFVVTGGLAKQTQT